MQADLHSCLSQLNMDVRNHPLGLVCAALCFLICVTRTLAADVTWYQYEGFRAVESSQEELHDRHLAINHLSDLDDLDGLDDGSVQTLDDELWRSTSLPDSKQKNSLFQSMLQRYHSYMLKWHTSVGFKRLRRSMVETSGPAYGPAYELAPAPAPAPALSGHSHHYPAKGVRWVIGFVMGAASGAIFAVLSAVVLHYILSYRGSRTLSSGIPVIFNKNISQKMLEFLQKDDALEGANLVSEGGSSKVYRVALDSDMVVAIKSVPTTLSPHPADQDTAIPKESTAINSDKRAKSILAELDMLGFIRHRNLVQLWAYIYRRDVHLLIYEFLPRGSLRDAFQDMSTGELTLTWPQRHSIMCGIAEGLAYLHSSHSNCIVHRDLKPGNILLTEDLEPKLADFGIAAILPDKATHATTGQLAGTIGYIAPEYHQTLRYSTKTDVYSFGVVLAQMVTAREPTEEAFVESGGSIGAWLQSCLNSPHDRVQAMDPAIRETEYRDEIVLAMKVAVFCMSADAQARPQSSDVLTMLLQIRNPDPARPAPLSAPLTDLLSGTASSSLFGGGSNAGL